MIEQLTRIFNPEKYYTVLDLRIVLIENFNIELHYNTIYAHIRKNKLKATKTFKNYHIKGSDIVEWAKGYFFNEISHL